jgi:alanine racemase
MRRSQITIDLRAVHRNAEVLRKTAGRAELWAVVKANAYGHGAADCAGAAVEAGARGLCVGTVQEGAALRRAFPDMRVLVMGPLAEGEERLAREAELDVAVSTPQLPEAVAVHLKVDTGMGRFGMSPEDAAAIPPEAVAGLMTHFATADEADETFAREQLERFRAVAARFPAAVKHVANSAATLRLPESHLDAVRCGVALYGLSPFQDDPGRHGLEPALAWESYIAAEKTLPSGASTGYGRRFVAREETRIGLVPVGYADGFRRDLTGTEVLVDGERRRAVGTVSMDSFAVELGRSALGAPVQLIGQGLLAEEHARHAGTINYEITCGIASDPLRADRKVLHG